MLLIYRNRTIVRPSLGWRARNSLSNCKNEYLVFALVRKLQLGAVVGSIVWTFRKLKKPRCRERNAHDYVLHGVCPNFPFPSCEVIVRQFHPDIREQQWTS